jgi:hypothetical protein
MEGIGSTAFTARSEVGLGAKVEIDGLLRMAHGA